MAKQTRAERRARRQAAAARDGQEPERAPAPREAERHDAPREHRLPRGSFVRESVGELRKVEWPGQSQVIQGTVVVLVACVIIGTYLYVADQVFRRFVESVLLGQ